MRRPPKLIRYASKLDRYNARHERARAWGKRWAEKEGASAVRGTEGDGEMKRYGP